MDNSKFKLLLVDDEEDILEFLSYNLRKEGFKVITADNGIGIPEEYLFRVFERFFRTDQTRSLIIKMFVPP